MAMNILTFLNSSYNTASGSIHWTKKDSEMAETLTVGGTL
jgi:hypothetical protein